MLLDFLWQAPGMLMWLVVGLAAWTLRLTILLLIPKSACFWLAKKTRNQFFLELLLGPDKGEKSYYRLLKGGVWDYKGNGDWCVIGP